MTAPTPVITRELSRARLAVSLIFFTNGIVLGGFAPRVPAIRDHLDLTYGTFGLAMSMWPVGALLLGLAAAPMVRHLRSSRVATVGMVASALAMVLAGTAGNVWVFGVALFWVGATDAWVDVAQNAHGLRVQRRYGRSIFNSFHALWSAGAVAGGVIGAVCAGADVSVAAQFGAQAVLVTAVNVAVYRWLLAGPEPQSVADEGAGEAGVPQHTPLRSIPWRTWGLLLALTIIAIGGGWTEDSASTWSASYMYDELGATAAVAAFAFIAMQSSQFVGRLLGDAMVDKWGQRSVARWGGSLVAVSMGLALAFPSAWGTVVAFGVAGFGVATLIPGAMHAANELPGLRAGTGLTILSWLLRLAFLFSPALVGAIADATSLRVGLILMPVFGLLVVALAGSMAPKATR
ncbi:MFS transporter [Demequina sp. B12]|uniref:MFS transporter n=1 Tax=Demequina sp. B12 TaxID=2992757 RepID=UPI00237B5317|nr:MFS transporter [Demequina sp. B12]MDE0572809.1 MFS transporter [Demequina sp. B12]